MRRDAVLADPERYTASRTLGVARANAGTRGLLYPSVRDPDLGVCAVLFDPTAVTAIATHRTQQVYWSGTEFIVMRPVR